MSTPTFGQNVKAARLALGISQTALAKILGGTWTQAAVSQVERGVVRGKRMAESLAMFAELAAALKCEREELWPCDNPK